MPGGDAASGQGRSRSGEGMDTSRMAESHLESMDRHPGKWGLDIHTIGFLDIVAIVVILQL